LSTEVATSVLQSSGEAQKSVTVMPAVDWPTVSTSTLAGR